MSYIVIAIALLYNVSLAIHYQRRCALIPYTVEPLYKDISLNNILSITLGVPWYQLILILCTSRFNIQQNPVIMT